jgi:hypothetical protein
MARRRRTSAAVVRVQRRASCEAGGSDSSVAMVQGNCAALAREATVDLLAAAGIIERSLCVPKLLKSAEVG